MKKFFITWFVVMLPFYAFCQSGKTCDCKKDLDFVINHLENHYAGFQDNVTSKNKKSYQTLKKSLIEKANKNKQTPITCLALLKEYTNFFRDNHLHAEFLQTLQIDASSSESVKAFKESNLFREWERIPYDSTKIWQYLAKSKDPLEGIYDNANYQVAVMRSPTHWRDYYGIITQTKSPLWEKGQVKVEFKKIDAKNFLFIKHLQNYQTIVNYSESENPVPTNFDANKIFPTSSSTKPSAFNMPPEGDWFQFKVLNDSTTYLHIKSFDPSLQSKFDSIYKQITPILEQKPYLIIDLRSNGGGTVSGWYPLRKYLYTRPIPKKKYDYYCSSEIIKEYEEMLVMIEKNKEAYGVEMLNAIKSVIERLKKAKLGTFVPADQPSDMNESYQAERIEPTPKKIIMMYNRESASAAEGFILEGLQSDKVLLFGENSGGFIAFGNITPAQTPSGFTLYRATSRFLDHFPYEKTGIPPHIKATNDKDWIEQTHSLWQKVGKKK